MVRFISKVTLLASGGAGHIYPSTTNPPVSLSQLISLCCLFLLVLLFSICLSVDFNLGKILQVATGDGIAMAHRAQAVISNME